MSLRLTERLFDEGRPRMDAPQQKSVRVLRDLGSIRQGRPKTAALRQKSVRCEWISLLIDRILRVICGAQDARAPPTRMSALLVTIYCFSNTQNPLKYKNLTWPDLSLWKAIVDWPSSRTNNIGSTSIQR